MKEQFEERMTKLYDLGLEFNGDSFVYHDINFHHTDLTCMTEYTFNQALQGAIKRKKEIDK